MSSKRIDEQQEEIEKLTRLLREKEQEALAANLAIDSTKDVLGISLNSNTSKASVLSSFTDTKIDAELDDASAALQSARLEPPKLEENFEVSGYDSKDAIASSKKGALGGIVGSTIWSIKEIASNVIGNLGKDVEDVGKM